MTTDLTLRKHPTFAGVEGPVLVVVMDGVGIGRHDEGDAVWLARTPTLDWLAASVPSVALRAHGTAVGLPSDGDMGNSEVGHNALGAGRVFDQGAKLINRSIEDGTLWQGEPWRLAVSRAKSSGEPIHFIGLLSDGNVHSHIDHLFALLRRCAQEGVQKVRVHALLDGRDVPETSALEYVDRLEEELRALSQSADRDYRVASGGGRMKVTMDRYEADWAMVERGWQLHVRGQGRGFSSLREAIETLRDDDPGVIDQNLPGFVITDGAEPVGPIRDGASVIFFNFRGDRALELTRAFEEDDFSGFDRGERPDVFYAGMMQYDGDLGLPTNFLVHPPRIDRSVSEHLAANGVPQLAISETQKFGHVTYFWNGNRTEPFDPKTERYVQIPSDERPFEERPWMKAAEITDRFVDEVRTGKYRHARLNYANGDMVGHTGLLEPTILSVEAVDLCIGRLLPLVRQMNGALIVTADHGNADQMFELDKKTGQPQRKEGGAYKARTSHSLNPVPCHVYAPGVELRVDPLVKDPGLGNVASTLLLLLGYGSPGDYQPAFVTAPGCA